MIRSLLYIPGNNPRFIDKGHERGADAIILDLEDSVPEREKEKARAMLPPSIASVSRNGARVFVRINSDPHLWLKDAEAAVIHGAFGLLLPKVSDSRRLMEIDQALNRIEGQSAQRDPTVLVPMIEDPGAVLDARAIATASPRVFGMLLGGEDYATAMGAEPTPETLRFPKMLVHLAAKAAGVLSFGLMRTVADFNDQTAIAAAAREARSLGFDGATCVHPSAVSILNKAFAPTEADVERARRLVASYEAAIADGKGACVFEGRMIDVPVVTRARNQLAVAASMKK